MPTSSFDKDFIIDNEKAASSLAAIIEQKVKSKKIDRSLTSFDKEKKGEFKLRKLFYTTRKT